MNFYNKYITTSISLCLIMCLCYMHNLNINCDIYNNILFKLLYLILILIIINKDNRLGILLSIGALESFGFLGQLAAYLETTLGNQFVIVTVIGLASSVVDNVPLVAATMGMYPLSQFPLDHAMWEYLAFCAGTGGSILIIGSAAGVAVMGMEKIDFVWYAKRIGFLALLGYFAGAATYLLVH